MPQVVADRQLMFSHFGKQRSDRVAKGMPAGAIDPTLLEGRMDFPF